MKKSTDHQPILGAVIISIIRFFSWFSLRNQHRIGTFFGWLIWVIPNSARRVTEKNLAIAFPELSDAERLQLTKSSLIETGKTVAELGAIWCWPQAKKLALVKQVVGADKLANAVSAGKGVIMLSPHVGCWEIVCHYLAEHYPTSILYRPPRMGSLNQFMRDARGSSGAILQPTDMTGVKGLRKALKMKEVIGILPDQDPGKSGGVVAPFFGHPANTMLLVAKLAQKSQCPVLFSFAERLPQGEGFIIHLVEAPSLVNSADDLEATTALNQGVENCVRQLPTQYQWSYKRYKNLPDDLPRPY